MTDTKFKPGQSGNPNGRPKGKTPSTILRKSIAEDMQDIIKTLVSQSGGVWGMLKKNRLSHLTVTVPRIPKALGNR